MGMGGHTTIICSPRTFYLHRGCLRLLFFRKGAGVTPGVWASGSSCSDPHPTYLGARPGQLRVRVLGL